MALRYRTADKTADNGMRIASPHQLRPRGLRVAMTLLLATRGGANFLHSKDGGRLLPLNLSAWLPTVIVLGSAGTVDSHYRERQFLSSGLAEYPGSINLTFTTPVPGATR